jgi:ABC-2 type transport system permease protein
VSLPLLLGSVPRRSRRVGAVTWAFVRMGARATFSYPLTFFLAQMSAALQVVAFLFLGHLTKHSPSVGSGYLAFAAIGLTSAQVISGGIVGLGQELDLAIQQGRMEMLLIEPISWRLIPPALAAWPILIGLVNSVVILLVAWGLGATFTLSHLPAVLGLMALGAASGLAIGILAGALRVLAKRGDPVATIYVMAAYVVSGQVVPINLFPWPLRALSWLFPNTYLTAGMRKALMLNAGQVYGPDPNYALLELLAICAILLPLSLWVFGRSLETGRKYGVLAGY